MLDSLLSEDGLEYKLNRDQQEQHRRGESEVKERVRREKKRGAFPTRWLVNVLLILLTSFEVVMIVHSQVYTHSDLLRSFLNFYADEQLYPQLFDGSAFYLRIQDIG
jgi:hypothetical protein